MTHPTGSITQAVIVETEVHFTLHELGRASGAAVDLLESLVHEGVLAPLGEGPGQWRFAGTDLLRARKATRLVRDLELNAAATALVLDLFDQIDALRSQLRHLQPQRT